MGHTGSEVQKMAVCAQETCTKHLSKNRDRFSHRAQVSCQTRCGGSCRARAESDGKQASRLRSSSKELIWAKEGFPQLFLKMQETSPGGRAGNTRPRTHMCCLPHAWPGSLLQKHRCALVQAWPWGTGEPIEDFRDILVPPELHRKKGVITPELHRKKGVSETCSTMGKAG